MNDAHDTLVGDAPAEAGELEGQILDGRYQLVKRLGAGGMGVVYAARHVVLESRLAIKVLRPPPASQAEEALERFRREARAASALGHPNIVDVRDFGTLEGGLSYYVMEHLEGSDLLAEIEGTKGMAITRLAHVGMQVADALFAAHAQGIVHRDLKPENVFLTTRQGQADHVKLIDFGIAKVSSADITNTLPPMGLMALGILPRAASPSRGRFTAAGIVLGTPAYMSPEQCAGRDVDFRSDLYALGVLLYEAATGVVPFDDDSVFELMRMHQEAAPPDPRALRADLPEPIAELILKCLAKDPGARPADMRAVQAVLAPYAPALVERPTAASIAASIRASMTERPAQLGRLTSSVSTPVRDVGHAGWESNASPSFTPPPSPDAKRRPDLGRRAAWVSAGLASFGVMAISLAAWRMGHPPTTTLVAEHAPLAASIAPPIPLRPDDASTGPVSVPSMPRTSEAPPPAASETPAATERPRRVRVRARSPETAVAAPAVSPPPEEAAPRRARPTDAVRDPWAE